MSRLDLTPFGFTPTESLIYEVLLTEGPGTGYGIARSAGLARAGNRDLIEFRLELQNGASPDAVIQAIKDRVARRIPDSWRNYQLGLFEFDFRFSEPGTLRTARKLRRLVDERTRSWE